MVKSEVMSFRHGRACPGHPRLNDWPCSASRLQGIVDNLHGGDFCSFISSSQDVDGRDKPGHDENK
jgi:hypothetical protein